MVVFALIGLATTSCGVFFIDSGAIAFMGIIPGLIFIWVAWIIWKENFSKKETVTAEAEKSDTDFKSDG